MALVLGAVWLAAVAWARSGDPPRVATPAVVFTLPLGGFGTPGPWIGAVPTAGGRAVKLAPGSVPWTAANGTESWSVATPDVLTLLRLGRGTGEGFSLGRYHGAQIVIRQIAAGGSIVAFVARVGSVYALGYLQPPSGVAHWLPQPPGSRRWADQVAVSADGSTIAGVAYGGDTNVPPSVVTYLPARRAFGSGSASAPAPPDVAYPEPGPPSERSVPFDMPWIALSPNGSHVAFWSQATASVYWIEVEDLRTGAVRRLVRDIAFGGMRFSPDGRVLAVWSGQGSGPGDFGLQVLDASTGRVIWNSPTGARDAHFVAGPHHTTLLVYTTLAGTVANLRTSVAAVPETGGKPRTLVAGPHACLDACTL